MADLLKKDFEKLKTILNDPIKRKNYMNFSDFDGKVSLDELSEIRELINNDTTLKPHLGGSSYCGNGVNFNFTWKGKPFSMRISIDDFHYKYWKENKLGYWKDK